MVRVNPAHKHWPYITARATVSPPQSTPPLLSAEKEYRQREERGAPSSDGRARDSGGGAAASEGGATSSSSSAGTSHSTPPWPAYEPSVLYNYRDGNGLGMNDRELASMCFPNKVCVWGGEGEAERTCTHPES